MLPRIHTLHPELANQIAAGEVVERPASIVKELLENSLDANAKSITITIEEGGVKLIRIQDDGSGIHPEDLALSVSRHATSKISDAAHLAAIQTLGFRGEALASISSVAELTLTSRAAGEEMAWQVVASGRDMIPVVKPAAHPQGTTVVVKNLFYNTPARKKFLRSGKTEWQAIIDVIIRMALSRYEVAFTVFHDNKRVLQCPAILDASQAAQRITALLSQGFLAQANTFTEAITSAKLHGWIGAPDFSRSSSDWQFFYVNGRIVKDKLIQHAIRQAYGEQLLPGRYAAYVIYLEIDPNEVDVNVHPTKHEVRFHHNRMIHDFIVKTVTNALNAEVAEHIIFAETTLTQPNSIDLIRQPVMPVTYRDKEIVINAVDDNHKLGRVLTVLENKLIVTETPTGQLGIVNIHAALSCALLQNLQFETTVKRRPLLIPESLATEITANALTENTRKILQILGFVIELIGEKQYIVREAPAFLEHASVNHALVEIFKTMDKKLTNNLDNIQQVLYPVLACASAPHVNGIAVTQQIISAALRACEILPAGARCQHGLLAWKIFSSEML